MVMRANEANPGIGGHLSTYASAATLYEVGFQPLLPRVKRASRRSGLLPGARVHPASTRAAFVEGRLSEENLGNFRREVGGKGLSSYPHPHLMPNFWQFPTVSMGLGPIAAIYQARFNRYLRHRGILDTSRSRVWAFVGDGECDEPETLGALHLASREKLGNLIFVVNCNLQRLDGPVRGNGKIIQELEAVFNGAGWERDQGHLGAAVGSTARCRQRRASGSAYGRDGRRPVPKILGRERGLYPPTLLRRPPPSCSRWSATCRTTT